MLAVIQERLSVRVCVCVATSGISWRPNVPQQYNPHLSKYQASLRRKDVEMIHRRQNKDVNTKTKAKAV